RERYGAREMIWMWLGRRPLVADLALVSVLLLLTAGAASRSDHVVLSAVLGALETLPLVLRRQRPALVLACRTPPALPLGPPPPPPLSPLGSWGLPPRPGAPLNPPATTRPPRAQQTLAYASIASVGIVLLAGNGLEFGAAAARIVFLIATWLLGESVGSRRA